MREGKTADRKEAVAVSTAGNYDAEAIKREFKQRFMAEFASYIGGDIPASNAAGLKFLLLFIGVGGAAILGPLGAVAGMAFGLRGAMVMGDVTQALQASAKEITHDFRESGEAGTQAVDRWVDAHADELPAYLAQLDAYEKTRRRVKSLVDRINHEGSADGLKAEDREFLRQNGFKKLRSRLVMEMMPPPRNQLGNWHHSQIARAMWKDVKKKAGSRGRILHRIFGIKKDAGRMKAES